MCSVWDLTSGGPLKVPRTNIAYYYKEFIEDELIGPLPEFQAVAKARSLSNMRGHTQAIVGTYIGTRPNDPILVPPVFKITHVFLLGKLTLKGHTAEYNATMQLPLRGPWAVR